MHHHLGHWWARVAGRGLAPDGVIHAISGEMWSADDCQHFGTDWTLVPCGRSDARIISALLPHGSTGPTTRIRRTMLPQYVQVKDDDQTLETVGSGTWEDLAKAAIALTRQQLGHEAGIDLSDKTIKRRMGTMDHHKCLACTKG